MGNFKWNDKYSVNISQMDEEHKKLVALIGSLDAGVSEGKGQEIMLEITDGVIDYIKTHFASEERLMKENDYPDYLPHRQAHIHFTIKAVEYRNAFQDGRPGAVSRMSLFLIEWLLGHIMGVDKRYGKYLNEKGLH